MKAEPTEEGGMRILAYDWETGEFVPDTRYLTHLFFPSLLEDDAGGDIDYISAAQFDERVAALRSERLGRRPPPP